MQHVADIDVIVVPNETAALLLENNLIKQHQPPYNVLLKNSGGYPYIVVTSETHPRLLYTRDQKKVKGKYYGPFPTIKGGRYDVYDFLYKFFPLRKCRIMPKEKCMFYDIGQCLGPCINNITSQQYQTIKQQIHNFFKGDIQNIKQIISKQETSAADAHDFEEAAKQKKIIDSLEEISQQQNIELVSKENIDIIGYYVHNNHLSIVIFSYIRGKLLTKNQQISEIFTKINEELISYLVQYYHDNQNTPNKCIVNLPQNDLRQLTKILGPHFVSPKTGKYKIIMQTVANNAKTYFDTNYLVYKQRERLSNDGFNTLRKTLNIDNLSLIHVFDISNLFAEDKVGAMIGLTSGQFNKNLYRKFIIKNTRNNSDANSMSEVIYRRYHEALKNREGLPNLIIVDGGTIQINAAVKTLKQLGLNLVIPVIGLVKNQHHKTHAIMLPNNQQINLDKSTPLYLYLFNLQEEVHRFAINFFRAKNYQSKTKSILNSIKGLGNKGIEKLLNQYDNIDNIRKAPLDELSQYIKPDVAKAIKKHFKNYA
jgi:excinuclease ABC subunit C